MIEKMKKLTFLVTAKEYEYFRYNPGDRSGTCAGTRKRGHQ